MRGAIVGLGNQGQNHLKAMQSLGIDVVAVCDTNPEARNMPDDAVQRRWERYTNLERMLACEQPEIVSVTTWTRSHAPAVIAAAKSGSVKYVFCEKPIANSLFAARAAIEACQEYGVLLAVNHTRRWWRDHQTTRRIIRDGTIGEIRSLWISCGGARLIDQAPHFVDWMRWITGREIIHVLGYLDPINEPNPRDPDGSRGFRDEPGYMHLLFDNGVKGVIDVQRDVALPPLFIVNGTRGRMHIEEYMGAHDRWELRVRPEPHSQLVATKDYYGRLEDRDFPATGEFSMVQWCIRAMEEMISGTPSCTGEDGYRALEAIVAAHVSHEIGDMPIALPLAGYDLKKILPGA